VLDENDECPDTPKGTVVMANGCPKPVAKLMAVMVNFDFDKSDLKPAAIEKLDALAKILLEDEDIMIDIGGYADDVGTETYNQALSERRAATVMAYLAGKGVAESRMKMAGYGEMNPLVSARTEEARAQNRRAMITPYIPE
jgi:OOP family OmpA-OmpF porin